jgi:AcrR family transcriptional regulator
MLVRFSYAIVWVLYSDRIISYISAFDTGSICAPAKWTALCQWLGAAMMETKERILKTAFRLFIKKGFTDVPINEIISKAGLTKGGFYHHFKSKKQLFIEVIDKYILSYTNDLTEMMNDLPGSSKDKLRMYFESLPNIEAELKKMLNDKTIAYRSFYLLLMEGIKKFDFLNKRIFLHYDKLRQVISGIIDEGKKDGSIKETVQSDIIAQHIITSSEGVILLWVINPKINLKTLSKEMFNNFWQLVKN